MRDLIIHLEEEAGLETIGVDSIPESFYGRVADYVNEVEENHEFVIKEFFINSIELKDLNGKDLIDFDLENKSIMFKEGYIRNYFKERFEEFKEVAEKLTIDDFIYGNKDDFRRSYWGLKRLIDDEFNTYIFIDDQLVTLDNALREHIQEGRTYYITTILNFKW